MIHLACLENGSAEPGTGEIATSGSIVMMVNRTVPWRVSQVSQARPNVNNRDRNSSQSATEGDEPTMGE